MRVRGLLAQAASACNGARADAQATGEAAALLVWWPAVAGRYGGRPRRLLDCRINSDPLFRLRARRSATQWSAARCETAIDAIGDMQERDVDGLA
jgi:hypothetical protein